MKRPLAYVSAAQSGNEFANTETAAQYCRALYEAGYSPICPMLYLSLWNCQEKRTPKLLVKAVKLAPSVAIEMTGM